MWLPRSSASERFAHSLCGISDVEQLYYLRVQVVDIRLESGTLAFLLDRLLDLFVAFSTISSIRAGWMRRRLSASQAQYELFPCGPDRTPTALLLPGVSSIMRSTPVMVSKVRILRPSRPMILPFISSDGMGTTDTAASATWSPRTSIAK